ncbi:MAG: hypothetical protein IPN75_00875 [Dechloromonas sp.]|uniref:Uncharacterized protein n=1 Tax=Candidatus Dechloromonas phosphorivorans TaxID=2899244 RepID=A0A9D7LJG3_9RHOO|nr:hypothetical protein [Candidatus Dechloromonas phosphorivorans]
MVDLHTAGLAPAPFFAAPDHHHLDTPTIIPCPDELRQMDCELGQNAPFRVAEGKK